MEPTNEQRAEWAREALMVYVSAKKEWDGAEGAAGDLMADIGHWLMTHEDWTPDDVIKVFDRAKFAFEMENV